MRRAAYLPTLHRYAGDLARERHFAPRIDRIKRSRAWRDLGDLKGELIDLWFAERNATAKRTMQDIEAQRREGAR